MNFWTFATITLLLALGGATLARWQMCSDRGGVFVYSTCLRPEAVMDTSEIPKDRE
jgi:hypothetical protein